MHIISGTHGGRKLLTPRNRDIRPTSDKVRGAVFNMLYSLTDIKNAHVLDLFCGTGACGLESISRGAQSCTFVDNASSSLNLARDNAQNLGMGEQCRFILNDAGAVTLPLQYNIVFCDPPYGKNLTENAVQNLMNRNACAKDCIVIAEDTKHAQITFPEPMRMIKEKIYGDTKIIVAQYQPESKTTA